jgi:uncharacterized protein (DUF2235 family)
MALYAFDGTWNKDEAGEGTDTNVVKFAEAYTEETCYRPGVGTRFGRLGKIFGGVLGAGGGQRLDEMLQELASNFAEGDRSVDIVGFSRGAALALDFANLVNDRMNGAPVRFLGLWDAVASFGLPGNRVNIGHKLTLPDNVEYCFHAMSLDERRGNFPLTRVALVKGGKPVAGRLEEVWFRGVHSDVGGGNENPGLNWISLDWMFANAHRCGLDIDQAAVARSRERRAMQRLFDAFEIGLRVVANADAIGDSPLKAGREQDIGAAKPVAHQELPVVCKCYFDMAQLLAEILAGLGNDLGRNAVDRTERVGAMAAHHVKAG